MKTKKKTPVVFYSMHGFWKGIPKLSEGGKK